MCERDEVLTIYSALRWRRKYHAVDQKNKSQVNGKEVPNSETLVASKYVNISSQEVCFRRTFKLTILFVVYQWV